LILTRLVATRPAAHAPLLGGPRPALSEHVYLAVLRQQLNPQLLARLVGYDVQELVGQPSHALLHHTRADGSPHPQSECSILGTLRDRTSCHVESEVFWRKDGTSFPVF
jgi:hypothetical protein